LKDDSVYLRHILDEIEFLERIAKDRTLNDLINDDYFSHAVRSAIEVIGEAANNVPESVKLNTRIFPGKRWPPFATGSSMDISVSIIRLSGMSSSTIFLQ
jgi:uncharacterized protein with HEPN domain